MRRTLAIARKEFIHIRRDPRLLLMVVMLPLIQLFLFSYAVSFDVKAVPTAILDQDNTPISRQYIDALQQSTYFHVTGYLKTMSQVDAEFETNKTRVVVIVGHGFGSDIAAGRAGQAQVLVDGTEPNSAQGAQSYSAALSRVFGTKVAVAQIQYRGQDPYKAAGMTTAIRTWYNPEGRSANYFVPGLIVILLTTVAIQQTANTLVKEKDQGTYEQLIVSPIHKLELMVGKIAPWAVVSALEVIAISVIGILAFQIPFRGSVALFALGTLLYVTCCLGIGLWISAIAPTLDSANLIAGLVGILPGFMLSGFIYPLNSVPKVLQFISYIFPARYFVTITRTIFLKGGGLDVLWPQFAALAVFAVVIVIASSAAYRERA